MVAAILTDTSPAGLRAAIEADIVATRLTNADVPIEAHRDPDAAWGIARDPEALRSVVVSVAFTTDTADRRIGEILADIDAARTATVWWHAPHHRPDDLPGRLERFGFEAVADTAAMALDLVALPATFELPAGLVIEPVRNEADARDFVTVIMTERPEGAPPSQSGAAGLRIRHITSRLALDRAPMRFVGRADGVAVATSRLSVVGGAAGLYGVVTRPDARGRGYGRAMTLAALDAGRRLGLRVATLQATDMGLPIYRRLGFEEMFRYTLLVRSAQGDDGP